MDELNRKLASQLDHPRDGKVYGLRDGQYVELVGSGTGVQANFVTMLLSSIPGFVAGETQFLAHNESGEFSWITIG